MFTAWHSIFEQLLELAVDDNGSDDDRVNFIRSALEHRDARCAGHKTMIPLPSAMVKRANTYTYASLRPLVFW